MASLSSSSSSSELVYAPPIPAERPIFYFTLAVNLINIPLIIYSLLHRRFLPIKSKQIWIISGIGFSITVYNISYNLSDGMLGYGGPLSHCRLWSGWFMMTFGLGMTVSLMNMRLILYYRVFMTRRTHSYKHFTVKKFARRFWPFFVLWSPALLTSIIIYIIPKRFSTYMIEDRSVAACDFNNGYLYWTEAYLAVQVIFSWLLYFRMRRIAKAFNEFRMAIWLLIIFTIPFITNLIILIVDNAAYPRDRIAMAFVNMSIINLYYWLIIIPPVYGHMFDRETTLAKFQENMHADGLIAEQAKLTNAHRQLYGISSESESYPLNATRAPRNQTQTTIGTSQEFGAAEEYLDVRINQDPILAQADDRRLVI
ncbi:hypothetical protein GQ54DRAFT_325137 [Martensiomyces pterosporus]|nr:hypothetical protein GQ54DRAFT_325137 [Martensiomyces pterosporus]